VAILAYGASVAEALGAARELEPAGIRPTVVNVRFAKPLDGRLVRELAASHEFLVTVEEAALVGGVGAAVCEELARLEGRGARVVTLGVADEFVPQATRREQMAAAGIDAASIARTVVGLMRDQGVARERV
jgi:1-deoxy-D-xylulose-5-phosphate synthase